MPIRHFGDLPDGRRVDAITLGGPEGLRVEVLTYGAILHELSIPVNGRRRALVLALPSLDRYLHDAAYVGPVVGRFANRIAGGRFAIDGQLHQLTCNENGNHLHGGAVGVGKRLWQLLEAPTDTRLRLGLRSPAGEEGYPGNLDLSMTMVVQPDTLCVDIVAVTDAPTPVNLTYHPYFNLGGGAATAHWLRIPASRYLPVGPGLIPTGQILSVTDTPFDFRQGRSIGSPSVHSHPQLTTGSGYDHCWVLDKDADCHCELRSPQGEVTVKVSSSSPGLQFYNGQFLSRSHPQLGSGLVLEPQGLPDSPNHANFPTSFLRPGQEYHARIEYQISHF
ncbi:MAG: aldose epimerase family protein [Pseudomonadota bacterium]